MAYERLHDRNTPPTDEQMLEIIGPPFAGAWTWLRMWLVETYEIEPVLQCGGPKYGWNLQHRKGGRPLCEMYPEYGSFTAMVVLGKNEMEQALARLDSFGPTIRSALTNTPTYHDGCWMYTRISDPQTCEQDARDIAELVLLKKKPPRKKTV
jgi:hypothetical protein